MVVATGRMPVNSSACSSSTAAEIMKSPDNMNVHQGRISDEPPA